MEFFWKNIRPNRYFFWAHCVLLRMGYNLVEKILRAHLREGDLTTGTEIGIRIDQTLTQDATGTMAYLQFEAIQIDRVQTELSVSYVDHNTLQMGYENADDHEYLRTVAAKYGIKYSKAGNGICHQVHLERFGKPGKTLLGSDSHTPTGGGIGMIAIGAGGLDVAIAMAGGPFYLPRPKVVKVELHGKLPDWVSAKDVILHVLSILGTEGNVGCILEYGGEGIKTLDVPARATITNMGAELGVTTSIFPSDEITRDFLKAQGREQDWIALSADLDAVYAKILTIDLSQLEPLIAIPHSPGNVKKVQEVAGKPVHQVAIGSCTNSSFMDLMVVANSVTDRKVAAPIEAILAPGSKQVFQMIAENGALARIIAAGFRIMESACGFCIGSGASPQSEGVSIRTNNRNFFGRSGTKSAEVYLVSPETATACAITGKITDPRTLGIPYKRPNLPPKFIIDDSMILDPTNNSKERIIRGPNISEPPITPPFMSQFHGVCTLKVGDKITTDHISPAGDKLKYRSNIPKYATFTFETTDKTFASRALQNKEHGIHNIIIGGDSYGQGSSREHAALCPMYLGVRAVITKSFERIHRANLINFGILPLNFVNSSDYDNIDPGDQLEFQQVDQIESGKPIHIINITKKRTIPLKIEMSDRERAIILAGGLLNFTRMQLVKT
jgi:aconitate hydratase